MKLKKKNKPTYDAHIKLDLSGRLEFVEFNKQQDKKKRKTEPCLFLYDE